jgi:hypothetical protein
VYTYSEIAPAAKPFQKFQTKLSPNVRAIRLSPSDRNPLDFVKINLIASAIRKAWWCAAIRG